MKAFLVCYNCKRGHNYSIDDDFVSFVKIESLTRE